VFEGALQVAQDAWQGTQIPELGGYINVLGSVQGQGFPESGAGLIAQMVE